MMAMSDKSAYQETYIRAAGAIAFIAIIKPQCDREAILGNRAKERLQELVATGRTHVSKIQCSCRPGTEGTPQCNYGRSCGVLTINGPRRGPNPDFRRPCGSLPVWTDHLPEIAAPMVGIKRSGNNLKIAA